MQNNFRSKLKRGFGKDYLWFYGCFGFRNNKKVAKNSNNNTDKVEKKVKVFKV